MCGLIYAHTLKKKPVAKKILKRYQQQRMRGTDGFGVYRPLKDQMAHNTKEKAAIKHLKNLPDNILMFHHRNPTSTDNVKNACHPFSTKKFFENNYVLIHNGHINNSWSLKEKHEKLGIKYISEQPPLSTVSKFRKFNDSEALLWEVALYLEGKQDKINATGLMAFICYVHNKGKNPKLYFARNNNPLKMNFGKQHLTLASTGEGEDIEANMMYCYDYLKAELSKAPLAFIQGYGGGSYTPPKSTAPPAKTNHGEYPRPHTPADGRSSFHNQPRFQIPETTAIETGKTYQVPNRDDKRDAKVVTKIKTAEQKLADRIKSLVNLYIGDAKGLYDEAAMCVLGDIGLAMEQTNDEDEALLTAVYTCIQEDPFFVNQMSVHPDYADVDKEYPALRQIGFKSTAKDIL